ncbi:MAG: MIP/aquaporin family protein [Gemmatimonadales bacterium]
MTHRMLRPLVAEFVATMLFVFVGAGSVVANEATRGALGLVGIALAHGVGIAVLITMTLRISGGHLNPAVSVGLWLARKIDGPTLGGYVAVQLAGAIVGALLVSAAFPDAAARATVLGTPQPGPGVTNLLSGIWIEAVLTFFLVSAVFGTVVSVEAPSVGGFGIGLAIFTDILVGGPLTGAAMNPARAFGPALVSGEWQAHAAYWIGPLLGAAVAAALWKFALLPRDQTELG